MLPIKNGAVNELKILRGIIQKNNVLFVFKCVDAKERIIDIPLRKVLVYLYLQY